MSSRLIIWLLLVLIPFQSFAAVGLIQCADGSGKVVHAQPVARRVLMEVNHHVAHGSHRSNAMLVASDTVHDLANHSQTNLGADGVHHQSHKLPCCSDNPVIFFHVVAPAMGDERFTGAVRVEPLGLKSVYLDGPERPPRLTLS